MRWGAVLIFALTVPAWGQSAKTKPTPTPIDKVSIDELLRRLEKKSSSSAQADAIIELGKRGAAASPAIPILERFIKEGRWKSDAEAALEKIRAAVKERAESVAAKRKTEPEIDRLIARLNLPDAFFRKRAAEDLAKLKRRAEPALPRLKELAAGSDEAVAKAAAAAAEAIESDLRAFQAAEEAEKARIAKAIAEKEAAEAKAAAEREAAEKARREAEAKAAAEREAADKVRRESEAKARAVAEEAARRREAEEKVRREAEEKERTIREAAAAKERAAREATEAKERAEREAAEGRRKAAAEAEKLRIVAEMDAQGEKDAKAGNWIDASKGWWVRDNVRVSIRQAFIGQIQLNRLGDIGLSAKNNLGLIIEITNLTATRKVDYAGWHAGPKRAGVMFDNFNNRYAAVHFGSDIIGQTRLIEAIHPGKFHRDLLVFEEPIKAAETLTLELPAEHFGGEGTIRFRIPTRMLDSK